MSSRILGDFRCEHCQFRSMTRAGLNTHIGKCHPGERLYGVWSLSTWRKHG